MRIVVGEPNQTKREDDVDVPVCDELGLPLDPMVYAKPSCNACYGRGVKTTCTPLSSIDPEKLQNVLNSDGSAKYRMKVSGKHLASLVSCHCAQNRQERVVEAFTDAKKKSEWRPKILLGKNVAEMVYKGFTFVYLLPNIVEAEGSRMDGHGESQPQIVQ